MSAQRRTPDPDGTTLFGDMRPVPPAHPDMAPPRRCRRAGRRGGLDHIRSQSGHVLALVAACLDDAGPVTPEGLPAG